MKMRAIRVPSRIWNGVKPGIWKGRSGFGEGVGDGPGDAVAVGPGDAMGSGVGAGGGLPFSMRTV